MNSDRILQEHLNSSDSVLRSPLRLFRVWAGEVGQAIPLGVALARRDFQARYRQMLFGYVWAVLPVLVTTLAFVLLQRARLLNTGEMQIPYPVYAFLGTMFWQLFATSMMGALDMAQSSRTILGKLYFPRDALLVAATLMTLIELSIKLLLVPVVLIAFGIVPNVDILMLPVIIVVTLLLGFSIGIILVPLNLIYQDIRMFLQILLSALVLITPAGFVAPQEGLFAFLISINPLTPLINIGRASLTAMPMVDLTVFGWVGGLAVLLMLIALPFYHIALPIVVERQSA